MTPTTVSPEVFEREAKRRLIDTHELARASGSATARPSGRASERGRSPNPCSQDRTLSRSGTGTH